MKNQFNNLLYTGLVIVGLPLFLLIILIILPIILEKNNTNTKVEDHIKIYDTITIEKIKWIERVKPDTLN